MKKITANSLPKIVVFIGVVLLWICINITTGGLIPSPQNTFLQVLAILRSPGIYGDIFFTILNVTVSLLASFFIAASYVLLFQIIPNIIKRYTSPVISVLLFIPAIITVYICIIIFGYNSQTILIILILVAIPVLITSFDSLPSQINREYFKISRVYNLSAITTIKKIIIPQILPLVSSAMDNGFSIAMRIAILAEAIIGNKGIGYQISYNFFLFDLEKVLALSIISITIIYFFRIVIYKIYLGVNRIVLK